MTNRIAADPRIDPRIKAVFAAPDRPPLGDIASREALLAEANSPMALAMEGAMNSFLDACDNEATAPSAGLTVTEVRGYGRQRGKTEVYRGAEYEVKLLPKVKLEIAVPTDIADAVVEAVARTANTGKIGDGKVFVLDLEKALLIRTGDTDAAAIAG